MKRNFLSASLIAFALVFLVGCPAAEKPKTQKILQIDEGNHPKRLEALELKPSLSNGRLVINEATLAKMEAAGVSGSVLEALRNMETKSFNSVDEFKKAVNAASPEAENFMDSILGNALVTELDEEPKAPPSRMTAKAEEKADAPPTPPSAPPEIQPPPSEEKPTEEKPTEEKPLEPGEKPPEPGELVKEPAPPTGPVPVPPIPPAPAWGPEEPSKALSFDTVLFAFDKWEILPDYKAVIEKNATKLLDNPSMVATIEGHADERGTNEYNLALGQRRAEAIRDALVGFGVPPSQLQTITFGEERPADLGHNEEAWSLNRRGEMVVSP